VQDKSAHQLGGGDGGLTEDEDEDEEQPRLKKPKSADSAHFAARARLNPARIPRPAAVLEEEQQQQEQQEELPGLGVDA
jgi:hypothetical protein